MTTIATRIAEARKVLGFNQSELARALGVSPQAVQSWESGKARPKGDRLDRLAATLEKSVDWILTGRASNSEETEASKSISTSFIDQIRKKVIDASTSPEAGEAQLKLFAEYILATEQMKQAERAMRDLFLNHMKTQGWFGKIEDPTLMMHVYLITQGAAEGTLLPSELDALQQIASRLKAVAEAEEDLK
ncbi:helix-turn-helix domain-containing protein [Pseudomonas sp. NBRC 111125]|uniref:helix-turn-helix domain-containing protein n=1 Tax=Pseudomonas sp. NBRC 111125 TaxID=1661040 RepID=UPI000761C774|nr:helix-turn-helix transcriptional regulator [Pseudomonas sp. NBRC 111125]